MRGTAAFAASSSAVVADCAKDGAGGLAGLPMNVGEIGALNERYSAQPTSAMTAIAPAVMTA